MRSLMDCPTKDCKGDLELDGYLNLEGVHSDLIDVYFKCYICDEYFNVLVDKDSIRRQNNE